jgi:hypothetical protein
MLLCKQSKDLTQIDDYGQELCGSVQVQLEGPCVRVNEPTISVKQGEILGQLWNY